MKTKIVFLGTPDFSVPTLEKLYLDDDIDVGFAITKIDSKSNRGQKINFSKVKEYAISKNIGVLQPISIKDDRDVINRIREYNPDFLIVVAYGQILSKEILDIPKYACINGHASLLPKYRGASPIQTAILNGDSITGTTSMLMDVGLDTGDILEQNSIKIYEKETSDSLFDKLSILTADTILHTVKNFKNIKPVKQDDSLSSKSIIIKKEYGKIDFKNETAVDIERKIRAYTSWPSAFFEINDLQYKIWDSEVVDSVNLVNAKVFSDSIYIINDNMFAKCKDGFLKINVIQKSGKSKMNIKDFINGLK